jgi:poly(3-hydroxybutyrate) depolymerase
VHLVLPDHIDGSNLQLLPLVLHLHGGIPTFITDDPAGGELGNSGYADLPNKYNVIVAAPPALAHPLFPVYQWNITEGCCGFPEGEEPKDVGFLNELLDTLLGMYPIDPERVYLFGYSDGAAMAYRLACDHTERFAALASGAGHFPELGRCAPSASLPVLQLHSRDDDVNPFSNGEAMVDYWADHNGCVGELQFGEDPTIDLTTIVDGKETTVNTFEYCPDGNDVELWSMDGVPHVPRFFRVAPNGLKPLAERSWKFLRLHRREQQ